MEISLLEHLFIKKTVMRTVYFLAFSLIFSNLFAQKINEKKIETSVSEVTVFISGAQINRKKQVELPKGKTILKFTGLSPFVDGKSVQVKANGNLMVLSVNFQQNFMDKPAKSKELSELKKSLEKAKDKIELENTHLSIIEDELEFLYENRDIGGKNAPVSVTSLQQTLSFYTNKITELKLNAIERKKNIEALKKKQNDLESQISAIAGKKEFPTGEVIVKVDAQQPGSFEFVLSYLVKNAGWFPSYDIRAENIEEPVQLIYKANVRQDTKVDWKNVKLSFSSADPNVSGIAPELKPYFLDYNSVPPSYDKTTNLVSGKVTDSKGAPLPGVNVLVKGTTIGTVTDTNGNYSITIPSGGGQLVFSFIGYSTRTLPVTGPVMNVRLDEEALQLQEVVALDVENVLQGRVAGVSTSKKGGKVRIRGASSLAVPTTQTQRQTTVHFDIETPYTVNSDNKNYTVDLKAYDIPASYQYYSVPKIETVAFLIARITDWEQYNLLAGEANIFFENTYIGKTLLDVRYAPDTLEISLGRDRSVTLSREKIREFTTRQFIGNKKEETRAWKITVKNNKNHKINMTLLDQVPVSTREDIEVKVVELSGASHDDQTGIITWEFTLEPSGRKELNLKYSVKYPKSRNLIIE